MPADVVMQAQLQLLLGTIQLLLSQEESLIPPVCRGSGVISPLDIAGPPLQEGVQDESWSESWSTHSVFMQSSTIHLADEIRAEMIHSLIDEKKIIH